METKPSYNELSPRRLKREDGSLGPPQWAPWKKWSVMSRADRFSAFLNVIATFLCAIPVYGGTPQPGRPAAFALIAPLVAVLFFSALVVQFLERDNRHGLVRGLFIAGASILTIAALKLVGEVAAPLLLLSYWSPAILAVSAAMILQAAHRRVEA